MNFAANLKALRIAAGMSQEKLAHACGYSGQSRIGNYESSAPKARQPKPVEIAKIAHALGVTVGELFGEPAPGSQSESVRLDPEIVAMAHRSVRELVEEKNRKYNVETDPTSFVQMYELIAGINTPQGADKDGREDAMPDESAGKKDVARKVQRKA